MCLTLACKPCAYLGIHAWKCRCIDGTIWSLSRAHARVPPAHACLVFSCSCMVSLHSPYVIALDGALACRRLELAGHSRSGGLSSTTTRDLKPARATRHGRVTPYTTPRPHFTLSHVVVTTASLLPTTVYPSGSNDLGEAAPEA